MKVTPFSKGRGERCSVRGCKTTRETTRIHYEPIGASRDEAEGKGYPWYPFCADHWPSDLKKKQR
jgi:hypothetical protein